jgi:cell division septation protein DedD
MASPAPTASDVAAPAPAQPVKPPPAAAKGYRLQLGAMRTPEAAKEEWDRLQHQNGDLLGKLAYAAPRVDLGNRGVFYRIQAGPMAAATDANRACSELKHRGVSCILVKP